MRKGLIFSFDRRMLLYGDWLNFVLILALSIIGLFSVYSATYRPNIWASTYFLKQLFGVITGIGIYLLVFFMNNKALQRWGAICYYITFALLIFTLIKGSVGMGAQRWINLGIIKFQPSELAKLFFPAFFVTSLMPDTQTGSTAPRFIPVIGALVLSCLLVLKQPDLGTAVIIFLSGALLLWLANLRTSIFLGALIVGGICAPLGWSHLKPFQKQRILVYFGGGASRHERYQIEQSQIAIGSGGIFGKGYLKGTQNQLSFLPENRTDFIFSVICEETGFVGALTVILLFFLLFLRALYRIKQLPSATSQLMAIGLITPLMIAMVVNISMVIGLLPTVGIPLPFITYGITHLWIGFAGMGWYNNIVTRAALVS